MTQTRRHKGVRPLVMDFLERHPGEVIDINRIAMHLQMPNGTVSSAVSALRKTNPGLEQMGVGAYRYTPSNGSTSVGGTGRLFEEVAELKDGRLLLRCEKGDLYTAEPFNSRLS